MAEGDPLGPLSTGLSRACSWLLAANVTLRSLSWTISGFAWKPANPLRSRLPAVDGHVDAFAVTADAFVGACFPSLLGWCRPHDPHFLRAFCTEQRPRVSVDDLVLQMMLYGHDDFPPAQGNRTMVHHASSNGRVASV